MSKPTGGRASKLALPKLRIANPEKEMRLANVFKEEQKLALKLQQRLRMQMGLNGNWLVLSVVIVSVSAYADQKSLEKTRTELHEQGFKTDLTNFNFTTSSEIQAREAVLADTAPNRNSTRAVNNPLEHPDLMESAGDNKAIIVWKQDFLRRQTPSWPDASYEVTWDDFADVINEKQSEVDAACVALQTGEIQFDLDASSGNHMLLRHLPLLKNLTQTLNDRTMLALHEGKLAAAWTNLLAATHLISAWNPEPVEISHRVRLENAKLVFEATWQVLQTNGWSDEQLAGLQREWESTDFLSHLPEVQAFKRVCDYKALDSDITLDQAPEGGINEDKERLLLFYRDREIEYRNAAKAAAWVQMRQLPGVTNEVFFDPKHPNTRFQMSQHQRKMMIGIRWGGLPFLAQAADAETGRRVVITALALERYREKHKRYPETLQSLAPEFLKSLLNDFATGQPLRYRLAEDGQFLLYSLGLDGVDNVGKIPIKPTGENRYARLTNPNMAVLESDVVWPLPATPAEVAALRKEQTQAVAQREAKRKTEMEAERKANEKEAQEARQSAMKALLAKKPALGKEPVYDGIPLSSWVDKVGQIERYNGAPEDAVAAIRAIGPKAVPFLLEWMPHSGAKRPVDGFPNWSDVEIAWRVLGSAGKSAIPTLTRILSEPRRTMDDYSVWTVSARAISYLGTDAIVPMLTVATNMQGQHELWELLQNFESLGTNGATAVPALIQWADDPDYWVRNGVMDALGGIGKRPDLAVPVLLNALEHDTNSMVRRDAATALGSFANDSEAVLPALTNALKDSDWQVRGGALSGLGKIQNKPEVVVPFISPFLYDANNVIQRSAAYALRNLGSEAGYRALLKASNAPSSWPGIGDIIYEVQEKMGRGK